MLQQAIGTRKIRDCSQSRSVKKNNRHCRVFTFSANQRTSILQSVITAGVLFSRQGKEMYKNVIYTITHMQVLFCSAICRAHFQKDPVGFSFCRSTCSRYQPERDVSLKDLGFCYVNSSFQHLNMIMLSFE